MGEQALCSGSPSATANGSREARAIEGAPLPALTARGLTFSYNRRSAALLDVSLEVRPAALTMILGRSGSGKTTLLRVLRGLLRPQQGDVRLTGTPVNGTKAEARLAYVPQTLGLVRSMTALDNTLTGALGRIGTVRSLLRLFPREIVDEAKNTLVSLGLGHKINERVHALSGGERQRVAIARALMQHPDVILADEFVSQLDPITATETLQAMRKLAHSGVTLLITTHETDIVAEYADHVVVMREGAIIHDGPAEDLTEPGMLELLA
ncbi:MAG: ATP-binding cassette domain-containing protein [Dehalococcoidia bacterium]